MERFKQESMYGLSTIKSGHCREVAIVERFKQESMHGLSTIKSGHCGEVAISRGLTVPEMHLKFPFNMIGKLRMAF